MRASHPKSEPTEPSRAEHVFLDYLNRVEAGEDLDFEQVCAAHADLEEELRGLQEGQAWASEVGLVPFTAGTTLDSGAGESGAQDATEEDDPWIGTLFHLKYRILRRIGRGGFGTVYEATDERGAGNPVAIKVLSGLAAESVVHQQSFKDEARRVTRLSHPNVVDWKVFDQTEEGIPYFVMELVPGEKFDQVLHREGKLEPERAARLLLQVVDALRAAHHLSESESILHLDLKPDNLFLIPGQRGREEQMKVIDFGIGQYIGDEEVPPEGGDVLPSAELSDSGPSTLTFMTPAHRGDSKSSKVRRSRGCTPEYASPEQVDHVLNRSEILPLDGRSDLYSLGVLGFQMLTGRLPFESAFNRLDVLRMHQDVPPPKLASMGVRVPKRLGRFIERCLEKKRDDRWPDTQAAYEFLHDIVYPPAWQAILKVTVPLVLAGTALGSWVFVNRDTPVPVAGLVAEDGGDLETRPLFLGPARTGATLRLAALGSDLPAPSGTWTLVRVESGEPLPGWRAAWAGADGLVLSAPEGLTGRLEERVRLQLDADVLHTKAFTAVWVGAETWSVPAVEIAGRPVEELAGLGVDPIRIALDMWIAGVSRADVVEVVVQKSGGEELTLTRGTGTRERERYRLELEDASLTDGANELSLRVRDASGAEWTRDLTLEVVRTPLAFSNLELVDAAGTRREGGDLPRCNRSAGRYVISPRTQATLSVLLSRAADVSWAVWIGDSPQPALRGSSTGRQRFESDLADLAGLEGGQPYEGRLRVVAREDAYVLHGEGSTRGQAELELAFRYENTEPRFTAQWVTAGASRELPLETRADGGALLFTNGAHADVLITRQEPVPMKIEVAWWPAGRPGELRIVENSDLRNLQTLQARLPVSLDADGRYVLRVQAYRYDTSANETGDEPDVEVVCPIVLDRAAPTLELAGVTEGQVLRDAETTPRAINVSFAALSGGDEASVDLHWSLRRLAPGAPWSATGELLEHDPRTVARLAVAQPWALDPKGADGRYRLELSGADRAGNALVPVSLEFDVALFGPDIQLAEPSGIGRWHPDAATGLWRVRVRAVDANGVRESIVCELLTADAETGILIPLRTEAGSARNESVLEGTMLLPYTLSDERVRLRFTAHDQHGAQSIWTSAELELPPIARPRPERVAVRFGGHDVESMRLVRGNAEYPYVFGGRGDAIENADFVRAGLAPFNTSPRKSRSRSWQIEYAAGEIEDFYLDEREVSVSQFLAFVHDAGGYAGRGNWIAGGPDSARLAALTAYLETLPGDRPVATITWYEASAYARWVGKRLPSWVEWEFAVRGGGEYRVFSAHDKSAGQTAVERIEAAFSQAIGGSPSVAASLVRGQSGDWTPGNSFADLCSNVSEWTCTAAAFESEADRQYPHRWAGAHPELVLRHSTESTSADYWIAGGSFQDPCFDFAAADYRPAGFADAATGFRCAVSLQEVQARLGRPSSEVPEFEEIP